MIESSIYFLLKKHFKGEKYYVDLIELFHEVSPFFLRRGAVHCTATTC